MPALNLKKGDVYRLNTTYDLLITGGPYLFFMGGNTAPAADSGWHLLTGPQVVPKGIGAHITAYQKGSAVTVSAFTPSGTAPGDVFTKV